jgi:hypothetical protein
MKLMMLTRAFDELDCIAVEFRTHAHNLRSRRDRETGGQAGRHPAQPHDPPRSAARHRRVLDHRSGMAHRALRPGAAPAPRVSADPRPGDGHAVLVAQRAAASLRSTAAGRVSAEHAGRGGRRTGSASPGRARPGSADRTRSR